MENSLAIALVIAAIGMSLLFLSLAFFYGLLSLLTATVRDRSPAAAQSEQAAAQGEEGGGREEAVLRAAAIAVALARAEAEHLASLTATPALDAVGTPRQESSWWTLHHQRQLTLQQNARRGR